jgi:hypothetical protein
VYRSLSPAILALAFFPAAALSTTTAPAALSLKEQAEAVPAEFRDHFFNAPLAARVELDGAYLGEAMLILTPDERVQLIRFADVAESKIDPGERARWAEVLSAGIGLGPCSAKTCATGLHAAHFDAASSTLSLVSRQDARVADTQGYYTPPSTGSGVILGHRVNVVNDASNGIAGRYWLEARGSIGAWTTNASAQLDRSTEQGARTHHSLQNLYAQREMAGTFVRAGFFQPDGSGVIRQPRTFGNRLDPALGVMVGSSDTLRVDQNTPSTYPVYVTASRPAVVEIYRDGVLIHTQPVASGLQPIDTRPLPGGIYQVELRVIEDGNVTTRSEELIYKPTRWTDPSKRWRYNVFAGRIQNLWSNVDSGSKGAAVAGGTVNYLLHPRAIGGLSVQRSGSNTFAGASLDWEVTNWASMYANLYHSGRFGRGIDTQLLLHGTRGSVVLGYSDTWLEQTGRDTRKTQRRQSVSVSTQMRVAKRTQLTARVSRASQSTGGQSIDLGVLHSTEIKGSTAQLRAAVFNRPLTVKTGTVRDRGIEIGLTMALGTERTAASAALGTRAAASGGRDLYGSVTVNRTFEEGLLSNAMGTVNADRYGLGFSTNAFFNSRRLRGDVFMQNSTMQGGMTTGLNLENSVIFGAGRAAVTGDGAVTFAEAGMIVDVESDVESLALSAQDSGGHASRLTPGRNFVAVSPYRPGRVQFDFAGYKDHGAVITTPAVDYHLNRGGIGYATVRVMKTMTVIGRLVDVLGRPLKGVQVANHAGRTFTEPTGVFALELSEHTPTLDISRGDEALCQLRIDKPSGSAAGEHVMAGDLVCGKAIPAAQQTSVSSASNNEA